MSFSDAVHNCFSKYARFEGRARRAEYWYWVLFNAIISVIILLLEAATGGGMSVSLPNGLSLSVLSLIVSAVFIIPTVTVTWRRLHDIGKSGAWYLLVLIPLVGAVILLVLLCKPGETGSNAYGPDPKAR